MIVLCRGGMEDSIKGSGGEVPKWSVEDTQPVRVDGENQPKTLGLEMF